MNHKTIAWSMIRCWNGNILNSDHWSITPSWAGALTVSWHWEENLSESDLTIETTRFFGPWSRSHHWKERI